MKVGDIVYHKVTTEMPMVVVEIDKEAGIRCRWWSIHEFKEDNFISKELLFDGEQQQKKADCGDVES